MGYKQKYSPLWNIIRILRCWRQQNHEKSLFLMESVLFTIHTYLNYFSKTNCSITFQEQLNIYYKAFKVIACITSKCLFVFNKTIFGYIFGWFLMNFTQKLATYVTFRFQFVVQFLTFVFVVSGTNNFIDTRNNSHFLFFDFQLVGSGLLLG